MAQGSEGVFVDTNILVYSTFEDFDSEKHTQSLKSLDQLLQSENQLYVSPQILREYFATMIDNGIPNLLTYNRQDFKQVEEIALL